MDARQEFPFGLRGMWHKVAEYKWLCYSASAGDSRKELGSGLDFRAFNLKRSSAFTRCLVLLCLFLVFSSALIQASHLHPLGPNNELKECPVCHLAAGTAQVALVVLVYFVVRTTIFAAFAEDQEPKTFLGTFSLFSRPPPLA
jgi:hypothetical protein